MDVDRATFVLVHSPLVGPMTWSLVASALKRRGVATLVPEIAIGSSTPHWERHARSVAGQLPAIAADRRIVLVGHSGAGVLLPAIRHLSKRAAAAYLFVDAGLPSDGAPRLPAGASRQRMQAIYECGEQFPAWTDEDLQEVVPDADLRRQLLADVRPQPWSFWIEPIGVFSAWPDAPCGYVRFGKNPSYDEPAAESQRRGWPFVELPGDHFEMLVEPDLVSETLLTLTQQALS
jgi:hypothetical protein